MGRPPKCNPCCHGFTPAQVGDIFAFGLVQTADGYTIGTDSWVIKSDYPAPGRSPICLSAGGTAYATSGFNHHTDPTGNDDHDAFTPVADSWQAKADYTGSGSDIGASVSGKLYVSGYGSSTPPLRRYDGSMDSWATMATQSRDFRVAQSSTDGTDVYAYGGEKHYTGDSKSLRDAHKYDVSGDSWSTLTNMPRDRERGSAFSDESNAYMLGGRDQWPLFGQDVPTLQLDTYSYSGDSWSVNTSLPSNVTYRELLSGTLRDAFGYAMFGEGSDRQRNDRYDTSGDSWSALTGISPSRTGLKRSATIP